MTPQRCLPSSFHLSAMAHAHIHTHAHMHTQVHAHTSKLQTKGLEFASRLSTLAFDHLTQLYSSQK